MADPAGGHDITTVEMTIAEESRLVHLEEVVDKGLDGFIEVGLALTEIRDRRLYRQTHGTFDEYLSDRFGISRSRGYQYIDAARMSTVVDIQNERQARALSGLDDQQARQVYEVAVARTNGTPTAKAIVEAREKVLRRRRPLPDAWRDNGWKLEKVAAALCNLTRDDRFARNTAVLDRFVVQNAIRDMQAVVTALGMGELVLLSPAEVTMGTADEQQFETALSAARSEDDLSAENVAAKVAALVSGGE